jgi:hypothetical protein
MSLSKQFININPAYASNNQDPLIAGLYQIAPNNSNLIVRVNTTSNIGLAGEIQLNQNYHPAKFQGYNGTTWLDLNASQGPQGIPGKDFTNAVNFNNLPLAGDPSIPVTLGSIFATTYINAALNISNVNIRSIAGGTHTINSNLAINNLNLTQNSNIITLSPQPIPYTWDFTNNYNQVTTLKNAPSDTTFYSWGETSKWYVANGYSILKGQAVIITNDISLQNLVIKPITYTSLIGVNPFSTPMNMLGIATQNANSGETCIVCTKGITTVLCTSNITTDFISSSAVSAVGIDGIVGKDGGIFCNTTPSPIVDYIRAGYFLETGNNIAANGNYTLFYVEPRLHIV